jgi:hypothetical protein
LYTPSVKTSWQFQMQLCAFVRHPRLRRLSALPSRLLVVPVMLAALQRSRQRHAGRGRQAVVAESQKAVSIARFTFSVGARRNLSASLQVFPTAP